MHPLFFSTEPGAKLPDIEATVNSCSEHNANNSAAVRVTDMEMTHGPGHQGKGPRPCPVLEAIEPAKCIFESSAKDLAANVDEEMLDKTRCDEGDWKKLTALCPYNMIDESKALRQGAGYIVGWGLLGLAFAVSGIIL